MASRTVSVKNVGELAAAVRGAREGDEILLADGRYSLQRGIEVSTGGVTLRSESGDRTRVILHGRGMTGVARRFRGRGLAELIKRHALACAAAKGVTMALTDNDETNAAMLAVNDKLGYRRVATRLVFIRRSTD